LDENLFLTAMESQSGSDLMLATIVSADSSAGTAQIQMDGTSGSSGKAYKALRSAWPLTTGDRVVLMKQSGTYVILGKIGNAAALPISLGGSGQTGSSITTTIAQIATAGTNMTITRASFYQWGKLAMLEINGAATATVSGGSVIFTLVSGKRPALNSSAQVWLSTSNTSVVKPNGEITLAGSGLSSGAGVTIMACYLLP
jgi:hypothetical protein